MNHIRGAQLSLKHLLACLKDNNNDEEKAELQEQEARYEAKFIEYMNSIGLEKSCHVERKQGADVSLMLEIALFDQKIDLFPTELYAQERLNFL